jgi:hypothetical protein
MANKMDGVDSLHVEIFNLNDPLVGFCFTRDIDLNLLVIGEMMHIIHGIMHGRWVVHTASLHI